jgi:hypothetical protein
VSTANNIRSGVTQDQRDEVRRSLNELVEKLAAEMKLDPCAVVLELRYYHQSGSNPYRTMIFPRRRGQVDYAARAFV